jgi:hypothetical protein
MPAEENHLVAEEVLARLVTAADARMNQAREMG